MAAVARSDSRLGPERAHRVAPHTRSKLNTTVHTYTYPSSHPRPACSTRYGASELHATASLIGGIAAQEAVKLITTQYMPLNNTYVYNGIAGVGGVLRV